MWTLSPTWGDLIAVLLSALTGWFGRTYTPSKKPPGSTPARRKR